MGADQATRGCVLAASLAVTAEVAAVLELRVGIAPGSDALLRAWSAASSHHLLQATCTGVAALALASGGPAYQQVGEQPVTRLLTDAGGPHAGIDREAPS